MSSADESISGASTSLVPFLFGASGLDAIPGTVLSRLLSDLGLSEAAGRTVVARLRRRGMLSSERSGRRTAYLLDGSMKSLFLRVRDGRGPVEWEGAFHTVIYSIPETSREFRDQLRVQSAKHGYACLRSGLLISATDSWQAVSALLPAVPDNANVVCGRLELSLPDARRSAVLAWELDELRVKYVDAIDRFRALAADPPTEPADGDTLRTYHRAQQLALQMLLNDPSLPPDLLPRDWPGQQLWAARDEFYEAWAAPVMRYVDSLVDASRTSDLARVSPLGERVRQGAKIAS